MGTMDVGMSVCLWGFGVLSGVIGVGSLNGDIGCGDIGVGTWMWGRWVWGHQCGDMDVGTPAVGSSVWGH